MKKISGILTVSLVAVMAVGAARADLAATSYVDEAVEAATANMEVTTNKVTDAKNFNNDLTSTTKYPSMAVAQAIVDQSTETITANVAAAQAAADGANDSISAMTLEGQTGNGVIKTVTQADGKVSATRETIVNADIATNAAIDQSKVSGLVDALAGKQASLGYTAENSANKTNTYNAAATDKATKFPTVSAAEAIADARISAQNLGNTYLTKTDAGNTYKTIASYNTDTKITEDVGVLKAANSVADNLKALDTKVAANTTALSGKQASLDANQIAAVNSGITADKVKGYDGLDAKITTAQTQADKGVADAAAAKTAAEAKLADVSTASTGTNPIVKAVVKDGTTVKVTAAALTEAELPAISQAKVTGLITALDGKQAKGNYITVPAADGADGTKVLTAKTVSGTTTYYWETIGR